MKTAVHAFMSWKWIKSIVCNPAAGNWFTVMTFDGTAHKRILDIALKDKIVARKMVIENGPVNGLAQNFTRQVSNQISRRKN